MTQSERECRTSQVRKIKLGARPGLQLQRLSQLSSQARDASRARPVINPAAGGSRFLKAHAGDRRSTDTTAWKEGPFTKCANPSQWKKEEDRKRREGEREKSDYVLMCLCM